MKTEKLYHFKTYDTNFEGEVITVEKDKGFTKVTLNKTLFYPEGGGQPYDTGVLGGFDVVNVQIKNDIVTHYLEGDANINVGDIVKGEINWDRRFQHMQCHTAEHIVTRDCC